MTVKGKNIFPEVESGSVCEVAAEAVDAEFVYPVFHISSHGLAELGVAAIDGADIVEVLALGVPFRVSFDPRMVVSGMIGYLQKSFDNANFYFARMRVAQSARMLPVIDTAYDTQQAAMHSRLKWMLLLVAGLALILIVAICYILNQMKNIRRANNTIREHNDELSRVSKQLKTVNRELPAANEALRQSNSERTVKMPIALTGGKNDRPD